MSTTDTTCTCPSGDGSLRWPCPTHPPTERDERLRDARGVATEVRRHEQTIPDDLSRVDRALLVIDAERRRLDAVVTAVRDLVSEDYQKTGREVSCGGYLVTDDGCFAGSLAERILRALDEGAA